MKKFLIAAVSLASLAAAPAHAGTHFSFGFYAPAPVYAAPAPVYYQPSPVVYYPPVNHVYYAPRVSYGYGFGYSYNNYRHRDHFRHGYNTAWNGYDHDGRGRGHH